MSEDQRRKGKRLIGREGWKLATGEHLLGQSILNNLKSIIQMTRIPFYPIHFRGPQPGSVYLLHNVLVKVYGEASSEEVCLCALYSCSNTVELLI